MTMHQLESTSGFVFVDIDGAPQSFGTIRRAKKILPDGAMTMARSLTYSAAIAQLELSGASGGLNAEDANSELAIRTARDEIEHAPWAADSTIEAGKGVDTASWIVPKASPIISDDDAWIAGVHGVVRALDRHFEGTSIGVEQGAPFSEAAARVSSSWGGSAQVGPLATLCTSGDLAGPHVLFAGSKLGAVDHHLAGSFGGVVIASGPAAVTPRAIAQIERNGGSVIPDFFVYAALLMARYDPAIRCSSTPAQDITRNIHQRVATVAGHSSGWYRGGCELAEQFIASWAGVLPPARPMP